MKKENCKNPERAWGRGVLVAAIRKAFVSFRVYSDVPSTHGKLPRAGHLFRCADASVHFSERIFPIFLLTEWI